MSDKLNAQERELANAIALQAEALATGNHSVKASAVVALLVNNVETLQAWVNREDRES